MGRAVITAPAGVVALRFHPHLHLHHHVHGPAIGYLAIGLAALASWAGLPGPGEAALVTGGVVAAHHRLDIAPVVVVAWTGATVGGIGGWLVGLKAGRVLLSAPGPLRRLRLSAIARGDRFYARYGPLAVFLTPSWVAGIHVMSAPRYLPANAAAALVWALLFGLGSFLVGPSIGDVAADLGRVGSLVLGATVIATLVAAWVERRRRRRRTANH